MQALSRRPRSSAVFAGLVALALAGSAQAQVICTGPDNLAGPCCSLLAPNLPAFNAVGMPGMGLCWAQCTVNQQNPIKVSWMAPVMIQCSEFVTLLTVTDVASGLPIMSGKMHLAYTRTWQEIDPSGQPHQVWRFAAKADLTTALVGIIPPCPAPKCLPPFATMPTAFFYGYVDYVSLCGTTLSENAIVLYHACDFFIHNPALSDRPGSFHPKESYAIVAPVSSAQPFIPVNTPSPSGPMIGEASRDFLNLPGFPCKAADPITSGQIGLLGGACLCIPANAPKHNQFRTFQGFTGCPDPTGVGGNFQALSIGFPGTLPWFNLTTSNIGTWANGNLYPGKESAWVDEGLFVQNQGCSGATVSIDYGGTTRFGWTIVHPVLLTGMVDLADNYTAPLLGPYTFPVLGSIYNTDRVIYTNTP